jgi:hypothetical protein
LKKAGVLRQFIGIYSQAETVPMENLPQMTLQLDETLKGKIQKFKVTTCFALFLILSIFPGKIISAATVPVPFIKESVPFVSPNAVVSSFTLSSQQGMTSATASLAATESTTEIKALARGLTL